MASSIQLHTNVFIGLHWIYIIYFCGDIYYLEILLCVVNHSLQIYLSYSKNCWVFHPSCLEGFPRVYLVSHSWLNYMVDLWRWFMWVIYFWDLHVADIFMRFTCCWYIHMWLIYKIHMCSNWSIKFLKFKHL